MNHRAWLLINALAIAPAWSQGAPPASFDLASPQIRQIVRNTAATQSGEPSLADEPAEEPKPATVKWVPQEEVGAKVPPAPRPAPAPRTHQGPISALVEVLVDEALGIDDVDLSDTQWDGWMRCPARAESLPAYLRDEACPGRQSAWGLTEAVGYVAPELRR